MPSLKTAPGAGPVGVGSAKATAKRAAKARKEENILNVFSLKLNQKSGFYNKDCEGKREGEVSGLNKNPV